MLETKQPLAAPHRRKLTIKDGWKPDGKKLKRPKPLTKRELNSKPRPMLRERRPENKPSASQTPPPKRSM